jgi:hypothetical protein
MRVLQWVGVCALAAGLMLATGTAAWAQSGSASDDGSNSGGYGSGGYNAGQGGYGGAQGGSSSTGHSGNNDTPQTQQQMEEQQVKSRNMERQKQLVSDTQKLVALANELKSDVDKSTKDMLSLDVVRKADEIEKLAHNVKERMKNAN